MADDELNNLRRPTWRSRIGTRTNCAARLPTTLSSIAPRPSPGEAFATGPRGSRRCSRSSSTTSRGHGPTLKISSTRGTASSSSAARADAREPLVTSSRCRLPMCGDGRRRTGDVPLLSRYPTGHGRARPTFERDPNRTTISWLTHPGQRGPNPHSQGSVVGAGSCGGQAVRLARRGDSSRFSWPTRSDRRVAFRVVGCPRLPFTESVTSPERGHGTHERQADGERGAQSHSR